MDRALLPAAGDPALPQPRRRPLRPAPRHPVRHPRDERPIYDEAADRWTVTTDRGDTRLGAVLRHGRRLPVGGQAARDPGRRHVRRRARTTPATGPTRASTSPASGSASSAPARPASSRSRSSPSRPPTSRCSSARRTSAMPARNAPLDPDVRAGDEGAATASTATRPAVAASASRCRCRSARLWRSTAEERPSAFQRRLARRAASSACCGRSTTCSSTRRPTRPPPSSCGRDPRDRQGPGGRRDALSRATTPSAPSAVPRHRLLRDLQPRQRDARRPARRRRSWRSRRPGSAPPRQSTSSTSSSSPPASTP